MTQNITSVTDLYRGDIALHSAYNIDYHKVLILELEAPKCFMAAWRRCCDMQKVCENIFEDCSVRHKI